MSSTRGKLIVWLWVMLSVIVFAITCWNIYNTKQQLAHFFDTQLIQTNLALVALHQQLLQTPNNNTEPLLDSLFNQHPALSEKFPQALPEYYLNFQLPQIFQIWDSKNQSLLYKSKLAPNEPLLKNTSDWEVFTSSFPATHLVYIVAEPSAMRNLIIKNITVTQIFPMVLLWFILLLLSWLVARWCIKPIERISHAVALRQPDYLQAINDKNVPREIMPLVTQVNNLFTRLAAAFAREKRFTADAAHELRTPLAALKIQAQVALAADDSTVRKNALNNIVRSVDRCTHLIEQLTILAHIKPSEPLNDLAPVNLAELIREVIAELLPYLNKKSIEIELLSSIEKPMINGNRIALSIMLRNIIDNAIRYSTKHTEISVSITAEAEEIIVNIIDQGPGIPAELHARIFEQFYRGENTSEMGSGLGLAIVEQIASLHHAAIKLSTPAKTSHGLCFTLVFKQTT